MQKAATRTLHIGIICPCFHSQSWQEAICRAWRVFSIRKSPPPFFKIVHFQKKKLKRYFKREVIRPCWYCNLDQIKNRVVSQPQIKWYWHKKKSTSAEKHSWHLIRIDQALLMYGSYDRFSNQWDNVLPKKNYSRFVPSAKFKDMVPAVRVIFIFIWKKYNSFFSCIDG